MRSFISETISDVAEVFPEPYQTCKIDFCEISYNSFEESR